MTYFQPYEFIFSSTAIKHKIDNTAHDRTIIDNIHELIEYLNPIREKWGSPIIISSGYRCKELNEKVGGVAHSDHLLGTACDMVPKNGKIDEFIDFMRNYMRGRKDFNQCIMESSKGTKWVHLSIKGKDGIQKCQLFDINN